MTATYAIGDIHGHLDALRRAHDLIEFDRIRHGLRDAPVVHVGDLVDRGPDSRGVIGWLRTGILGGQAWVVLKGNHDRMFSLFLDDPATRDPGLRPIFSWLHPRIGGAETLDSYGVRAAADRPVAQVHAEAVELVPAHDREFLEALPTSFLRGELLFVHAGIRPGRPLQDQTETELLWIRDLFLDHVGPHPWLVVHGHTAVDRAEHRGNRVNIDSGVAYGGPLSAIVAEGRDIFLLTPGGRQPLRPAGKD